MKIINPYTVVETEIDGLGILRQIEKIGRTCYKSEEKITIDSAEKFVASLINRGHEAMLEHNAISVRFVCDRGISHELVRHRIASFAQESTRYCNYSKEKFGNEITVIKPCFWRDTPANYEIWRTACLVAEDSYFTLLNGGATAQEARAILPNSLKTEIVMTMNLREWRHFFKLRTAGAAHPQMRQLTIPLLAQFKRDIPVVFDDIVVDIMDIIIEH